MQVGVLLRSIRFLGLRGSFRALRYGIQRDWLDYGFRRSAKKGLAEPRLPGSLQWARQVPHGAEYRFENASLELLFLAPEVLRITWKPGALPVPYAIAGNDWPGDRPAHQTSETGYSLLGSQLRIEVDHDGSVAIRKKDGAVLRRENPPALHGTGWTQASLLDPQAFIFGLGERACGWNLRGGSYRLWNQDPGGSYGPGHDPLYMSIPLYLCLQPAGHYLLFHENAHRGEMTFGEAAEVHFERGALRSYFFPGTPAQALESYTRLTGRPPMPPRWSLGYHQSRWGYKSQEEIRDIADHFKQHNLPVNAIHLDIDYMDGFRTFTFNQDRFGDVNLLSQDLLEQGIRLVAILDPGVKVDRNYPVFYQGKEMFCRLPDGKPMLSVVWPGWVHFPDFTDPAVRAWWGEYYPGLMDAGIAGVWHDMNEPSAFAPWGDKTLPLVTRHALEGQGGDHLGAHNLYALLMNRAGFDALRKHRPERRPWLLTRSGFAGGQRYAWKWTGDVETSWEALRQTVATMLGISLSGYAFIGSDVGGFSGAPDPELYLRWFQLGTFSPFFRTHSALGTPPREPWRFKPSILAAVRGLLETRCRLMPYLYTLAWLAHRSGLPLLQPAFWPDPQNPNLWPIADQFFLGSDLLLAPVLEQGVREREVLFPAGSWYSFWDDQVLSGPGKNTVPAELTCIPAFVRGGAILPLETPENALELHIYPPGEGELLGLLYSDEGDGYRSYRLDRFYGSQQGNRLQISRSTEGDYEWPYSGLRLILHGVDYAALRTDGTSLESEGGAFETALFNELVIELG